MSRSALAAVHPRTRARSGLVGGPDRALAEAAVGSGSPPCPAPAGAGRSLHSLGGRAARAAGVSDRVPSGKIRNRGAEVSVSGTFAPANQISPSRDAPRRPAPPGRCRRLAPPRSVAGARRPGGSSSAGQSSGLIIRQVVGSSPTCPTTTADQTRCERTRCGSPLCAPPACLVTSSISTSWEAPAPPFDSAGRSSRAPPVAARARAPGSGAAVSIPQPDERSGRTFARLLPGRTM